MMICFRCTAETKALLDSLVESGSYKDYGDAIAAAVQTQVLMEQEIAKKGVVVIDAMTPPTIERASSNGQLDKGHSTLREEKRGIKQLKTAIQTDVGRALSQTVPAIFSRQGLGQEQPDGLAELPQDMWAPGQTIPLDRWVLGQYNRLLPVKANARALLRLFLDSPKGLPISETANRIADEAAILGDYLRQLDERLRLSRDEALSTAFPTTGEDAAKSRERYANQFVVYQNGKGELSGLLVDLKFISVIHQRKDRLILPTRVAWEFATLENPVLEGFGDGGKEKFSPAERSLLLQHIATSVPVEAFAYRAILMAVQQGHNTPDTIDAALLAYLTQDRVQKLSQSYLASQRSGAVSRMSDLELITRQREGVRVSYTLTEGGTAFLEKLESSVQSQP